MNLFLESKQIRIRERLTGAQAEQLRYALDEAGAKNVLVYCKDRLITLDTNLTEMQLTHLLHALHVTVVDVSDTLQTPVV